MAAEARRGSFRDRSGSVLQGHTAEGAGSMPRPQGCPMWDHGAVGPWDPGTLCLRVHAVMVTGPMKYAGESVVLKADPQARLKKKIFISETLITSSYLGTLVVVPLSTLVALFYCHARGLLWESRGKAQRDWCLTS